jgi:hypothetical protein
MTKVSLNVKADTSNWSDAELKWLKSRLQKVAESLVEKINAAKGPSTESSEE